MTGGRLFTHTLSGISSGNCGVIDFEKRVEDKIKSLFRKLRWRLRRRLILKKGFVELNGIKIPICNKILSPLILDSM